MTKNRLTKLGLPFEEVRIDLDEGWRQTLLDAGYASAPVVLVPDEDVWSDFRADDLAYLSRRFSVAVPAPVV